MTHHYDQPAPDGSRISQHIPTSVSKVEVINKQRSHAQSSLEASVGEGSRIDSVRSIAQLCAGRTVATAVVHSNAQ
jgi:hypothetical protein